MEYKFSKLFKVLYFLTLIPFCIGVINLISILFGNRYSGSLNVIPTNIAWVSFFVLINIFLLIRKIRNKQKC